MDWIFVDIQYIAWVDLDKNEGRGRFLNFQMLLFHEKNILYFLRLMPTPLRSLGYRYFVNNYLVYYWSAQQALAFYWLNEFSNTTLANFHWPIWRCLGLVIHQCSKLVNSYHWANVLHNWIIYGCRNRQLHLRYRRIFRMKHTKFLFFISHQKTSKKF